MNALEKIIKARTALILDHPFFGVLAMRLKLKETDEYETLTTEGKTLLFNPDFVDEISLQQTIGSLAHIVMHLALGHHWRQGERNNRRWNTATDFTINQNLINTEFDLPDGYLVSQAYDEMSAEEIYAQLPEEETRKDDSSGEGEDDEDDGVKDIDPGKCGAVLPIKDKKEASENQAEWKAATSQALRIGNLSSEMKREISETLFPPLPWYVLLRDFVERTARNDYSWSRPSPRYFSSGIILPSLISEELPEVAIAIDTSGSIDKEQLTQFASEASAVLEAYNTTVRVIYCDSRVKAEQEFTRADLPLELNPVGGGGTDFKPVFNYIKDNNYSPACLIYLTDLQGRFPDKAPDYPVLWISTEKENKEVPFGDVIEF